METINYPANQRRLRAAVLMRELVSTVKLSAKSFIQPLFVDEALSTPRRVSGMNGISVDTPDSILYTIESDIQNGVNKFLLFPVPAARQDKDFDFRFAGSLTKKIKDAFGETVWLSADLCLCSYTSHGHCGILSKDESRLLNNQTIQVLQEYAAILAAAGVDNIAPSDMTDGRIGAIRTILDSLGYDTVSIMSYAAKFSSQFYGPFREACHSAPKSKKLTNRKTYQLSPFNVNDAIASALRDEKEAADILMVKPAALYTDVIARLKQQTLKPVAAYHVSGEYAAIEVMADKGILEREAAHLEVWAALQRSGADIIISYAARNARNWISQLEY